MPAEISTFSMAELAWFLINAHPTCNQFTMLDNQGPDNRVFTLITKAW